MRIASETTRLLRQIAAGMILVSLAAGAVKSEEKVRTWTDRTNTRQAQARLVSVEGTEVRLCDAAGTRLRTTLDALSEPDRRYVHQFVTNKSAPGGAMPVVRGLLDKLPGIPGAVARLSNDSSSSAASDEGSPGAFAPLLRPLPEQLPADLVHVRVSKAFLEEFIERDVDREQAIQDQILGTQISGRAHTRGSAALVLYQNQEQAVAEVVFTGTVHSRTVGLNGPVRMYCKSQTPFELRKFLHFGPEGIQSLETKSTARTRSQTTHVDAMLPGLRGRIAERVAWKRAGQLRHQADAIASRHTEEQLSAEFNHSVGNSIAAAGAVLRGKLEQLPTRSAELPTKMAYRSTPEYLEIVLSNPDSKTVPPAAQPVYEEAAKIAVRVHRAVLRTALTDPQLRRALRPLLLGLSLSGKPTPAVQPASTPLRKSPAFYVSWSSDQEWLEIDFCRTEAEPPTRVDAVAASP